MYKRRMDTYMLSYVKIKNIDNIANHIYELNTIAKELFNWVRFDTKEFFKTKRLSIWEQLCDKRYSSSSCFALVKSQGGSNKFIVKSFSNLMVIDEEKHTMFLSCKWAPSECDNPYNVGDPLYDLGKEISVIAGKTIIADEKIKNKR